MQLLFIKFSGYFLLQSFVNLIYYSPFLLKMGSLYQMKSPMTSSLPKSLIAFLAAFLTFILLVFPAAAQESPLPAELPNPGLTPDSPFYFLDEIFEFNCDSSPEKAQQCWEEKMAEAWAVAKKKDPEAVKKAFAHGSRYAAVLEKEATPEMEQALKEKAKIVKSALQEIPREVPELELEVQQQLEKTDKIKLAAEVSGKIKELCKTLSELDPAQYAETCKAAGDAPRWQRELDQELTREQQEKAARFKALMLQCMENPGNCACDIGIKSFDDACITESRLFAACKEGDENACASMGQQEIELPDYLRRVMEGMQQEFEKKFGKEGFGYGKEMKGEEAEGREFGEEQMREMRVFMEECQKEKPKETCMQEAMERFGTSASIVPPSTPIAQPMPLPGIPVQPGPPERIIEFGRDCHAVKDLQEKVRCFEDFYNKAQGEYVGYRVERGQGFEEGMPEWKREFYEKFKQSGSGEEKQALKREFEQRAREEQDIKQEYMKKEEMLRKEEMRGEVREGMQEEAEITRESEVEWEIEREDDGMEAEYRERYREEDIAGDYQYEYRAEVRTERNLDDQIDGQTDGQNGGSWTYDQDSGLWRSSSGDSVSSGDSASPETRDDRDETGDYSGNSGSNSGESGENSGSGGSSGSDGGSGDYDESGNWENSGDGNQEVSEERASGEEYSGEITGSVIRNPAAGEPTLLTRWLARFFG